MKPYLVAVFFFIAGIITSYPLQAQQSNISISGKVISADDRQPVPSANVGIAQKGIGTATNSNGAFILLIPGGNLKDTLRISCLGFKTRLLPVAGLKDRQDLNISLQKTSIELKEVHVATRDPLKIIQKAKDRIPENYINHPHVTEGFYRNSTTSKGNHLQLSEAVFDIYNFGYANHKNENLLKLIKARDVKNQRDFHGIEMGWKAAGVMAADMVARIEYTDILGKDGMKNHSFEVLGIVDYKGYQAYEIGFKEKEGVKENGFRGKLYIDTKTYAFLCFDFGTSPESLKNVKVGDFAMRMLMKLMNLDIKLKYDHTQVNYQQINGKWVLSGVTHNNGLYVKSPRMKYDFLADEKFNYVVTRIDTAQVAPFTERLNKNAVIEDHDTDETDAFWKDYNIILPDFNSEEVIKRIKAINEVVRLKDKFLIRERKLPKDAALRADSMFTFYHNNNQFNGSALIKQNGKVILSKSYGYANSEQQLVANEHTTYRIGSLSKSFTSVIINQLMNEGKLDSLAPIKTYLPWYVHGDITIEQLLTHRSGIPEYLDNSDYKAQIFKQSFTLKELVQKFCSDTLEFKSGTKFSYSNSGFLVLALIAQEVAGKPFITLLQERIFTPLQMTDTFAGDDKGAGSHQAIGYAEGIAKEAHYDAANVLGAGGISSSTADLLKFHEGLLNDKLLPKERKADMLKPRVAFTDYNAWYDYGWMTDNGAFNASGKHVITYHPGTDMGFFTMYIRQEDKDNCIILLSNTGDFPRYDMVDLLLDMIN